MVKKAASGGLEVLSVNAGPLPPIPFFSAVPEILLSFFIQSVC
jgi:hypothetical protein